MTVAKLWHMFMDSPAFTELAPEPKKIIDNIRRRC